MVEEYRIDQELVPTPHRNSEENRVLGRAMKQGHAMKILAQVINLFDMFCIKYNHKIVVINCQLVSPTQAKTLRKTNFGDKFQAQSQFSESEGVSHERISMEILDIIKKW